MEGSIGIYSRAFAPPTSFEVSPLDITQPSVIILSLKLSLASSIRLIVFVYSNSTIVWFLELLCFNVYAITEVSPLGGLELAAESSSRENRPSWLTNSSP